MFFFFFKQKTAYEMRISDWSSDVCSSDLRHHRRHSVPVPEGRPRSADQHAVSASRVDRRGHPRPVRRLSERQARAGSRRLQDPVDLERPETDRKSVGQGKSVSVRVDLGGRRIIKKKNKRKQTHKNN